MTTTTTDDRAAAYLRPAESVIAAIGAAADSGLDSAEARSRLASYGRNELPSAPPVPAWRRFLDQFRNPLTILLLFATAISFVVWAIERAEAVPYEAITILAIVIVNAILGYVQEYRAEQAVAALQAMSAPTARVLRDGQPEIIPTAEVVPGDILLLEEGDTIAADGRVIAAIALQAAEAPLTGESGSATKDTAPLHSEVGIGDRHNMVYSGTAIAAGRGRAVVTATGGKTEIGAIAGSLGQTEAEETPLQRELDRVGRFLGVAVIAIAIVISITILLVNKASTPAEYVGVLLIAVSLAVAAVPEGLTAITTVVLSLGMQRMARRNVIVRKLAAVEALGSTTTICSDKTGTLTRNEMTVRAVVTAGGRVELTGSGYAPEGEALRDGGPIDDEVLLDELRRTLGAVDLANNAALREESGRWAVAGDPTEGALIVAARKLGLREADLAARFNRVGELPFTSDRKLMSTAHTDAEADDRALILAKGAPDVLLTRCTAEWARGVECPLTAERRQTILATIDGLAGEALRTLGVAYRALPRDDVASGLDEEVERDLVFLGVVGIIDPPRTEARDSVALAQRAGIRAIMITGDHPTTAAAIATELGIIAPGDRAVSGGEVERMDDAQLQETVRASSVYARVAPAHKLRIVRALQANGAIAAMTGDGVNDAPALKAADIGVAMGITGTDVSKGAADMILTDDNFASIVAAVEEGRSIFANIQKFLRYLLSSNVGEVLTMFFGVILAGAIGLVPAEGSVVAVPLLATQILWINLLTDAGPALALGVEPDDPDLMRRPPRDPRTGVITNSMWIDILFVGVIMAIGTLLVTDRALPGGLIPGDGTAAYAQTMAFTTLVCFQLFNVLNSRSDERSAFRNLFSNPWLWAAIGLSALLQVVVIYLPFLQEAFGTVPLTPGDWLQCIAVGSTVLWLREAVKLVARRMRAHAVTRE